MIVAIVALPSFDVFGDRPAGNAVRSGGHRGMPAGRPSQLSLTVTGIFGAG